MTKVLVATASGCRVFTPEREGETEMADRDVTALAPGPGKTCLAVIEEHEIWERSTDGVWSFVTSTTVALESITTLGTDIIGGTRNDAFLVRLRSTGEEKRLPGFDTMAGRDEWFAQGPPLSVRALTTTADGSVLLAAVHVGGIPRSMDGGLTWTPTLPIAFDVHEVRAHPTLPRFVAAATTVGLCISQEGGLNWEVFDQGLAITNSLALALLQNEVLFSLQDGPFAERSQVWRWRREDKALELVRSGLPLWLEGKIDTGRIAAGDRRAAIADGGGNLWLSEAGSHGWKRLATDVPYGSGLLIVSSSPVLNRG